jgi:hypothetical protein
MNATLSLPPKENLDVVMLKVARDVAMDIYPLQDILKNNDITVNEFHRWATHPQFIKYLQSEKEAWSAASNTAERTKLKAGIVMEMFMEEAHTSLHDKKIPLNQRVELTKVLSRLAGFGVTAAPGSGGGPGGFRLQINIGPGNEGYQPQQITISANTDRVTPDNSFGDTFDDDGYDPFTSPNTLED